MEKFGTNMRRIFWNFVGKFDGSMGTWQKTAEENIGNTIDASEKLVLAADSNLLWHTRL